MSEHLQAFETVAGIVCNKPRGMTHTNCSMSHGSDNPLCRDYGKCRLYEKTTDQLNYVLHPMTRPSFLRACPGSGKTEVVGLKAAYDIRHWDLPHAGIAVLTFTNSAADVVRARVTQFAGGVGCPHYIGTLDSWLHGYILGPFAYLHTGYTGKAGDHSVRIVDAGSEAVFLSAYKTKYQYAKCGHVLPQQYYFDVGTSSVVFRSGDIGLDRARNALTLNQIALNRKRK